MSTSCTIILINNNSSMHAQKKSKPPNPKKIRLNLPKQLWKKLNYKLQFFGLKKKRFKLSSIFYNLPAAQGWVIMYITRRRLFIGPGLMVEWVRGVLAALWFTVAVRCWGCLRQMLAVTAWPTYTGCPNRYSAWCRL